MILPDIAHNASVDFEPGAGFTLVTLVTCGRPPLVVGHCSVSLHGTVGALTRLLTEKIPIHYRSSTKRSHQQQIVPVSPANVHDLSSVPVEFISGDDEDGRTSRGSLFSPKQNKPPAFLPGWWWSLALTLLPVSIYILY